MGIRKSLANRTEILGAAHEKGLGGRGAEPSVRLSSSD
jgi:hypothetical protein